MQPPKITKIKDAIHRQTETYDCYYHMERAARHHGISGLNSQAIWHAKEIQSKIQEAEAIAEDPWTIECGTYALIEIYETESTTEDEQGWRSWDCKKMYSIENTPLAPVLCTALNCIRRLARERIKELEAECQELEDQRQDILKTWSPRGSGDRNDTLRECAALGIQNEHEAEWTAEASAALAQALSEINATDTEECEKIIRCGTGMEKHPDADSPHRGYEAIQWEATRAASALRALEREAEAQNIQTTTTPLRWLETIAACELADLMEY